MDRYLQYAIVIVGLGLLCAGWVALQLWIQRRDPTSRSILDRSCSGRGDCGGKGDCGGTGACRSGT